MSKAHAECSDHMTAYYDTHEITCHVTSDYIKCTLSITCQYATAHIDVAVTWQVTTVRENCGDPMTRTKSSDGFTDDHDMWKGTAVAQWLRYCATNRKVTGSIPDGVTGIFH